VNPAAARAWASDPSAPSLDPRVERLEADLARAGGALAKERRRAATLQSVVNMFDRVIDVVDSSLAGLRQRAATAERRLTEARSAAPGPRRIQILPVDGDSSSGLVTEVRDALEALPAHVRNALAGAGWRLFVLETPSRRGCTWIDERGPTSVIGSVEVATVLRHEAAHALEGHRPESPEQREVYETEATKLAAQWAPTPAPVLELAEDPVPSLDVDEIRRRCALLLELARSFGVEAPPA
jgi:hypothetical protein